MKLPTVNDAWVGYEQMVLPRDCHPTQRTETRRAFYAGFWACLQASLRGIDEGISEEEGAAFLQALEDECVRFKNDVLAGRA